MIDVLLKLEIEQKNSFLKFLKQKTRRKDIKSIDLAKAIFKDNHLQFKSKISDNAYRALKKRLLDNLIEYLAEEIISQEATVEIVIIKQILVVRRILQLGHFKAAFSLLTKMEAKALQLDHYSLLSEIYHTQIQYSYRIEAPNQQQLFEAMLANSKAQLNQEKLNMAFATIQQQMQEGNIDLGSYITSTYQRFEIDDQNGFNYKSLFQLANIANSTGAYSNDYYSVNLFFEEKLKNIEATRSENTKEFPYKVDLMLSMSNIYLRKKKFKKSLAYIAKAEAALEHCVPEFKHRRIIQVYTLTALNLNYTGASEKAIKMLQGVNSNDSNSLRIAPLHLALATFLFQQGDIKKSKAILSKYLRSDSFYEKHIDREWTLNKLYLEVIIAIEEDNIDLAESRMNSLTRRYGAYFKSLEKAPLLPFLKLVRWYCRHPELVTSEVFTLKVEKTIHWKPSEQEDLFLMTVFAWLKAKMTKQSVYETTLDLVNK
jgi:hypothetical protein